MLLIPYGLWLVFSYEYHFLDGVNLLFHEAGHFFFRFLGETMQFLGGSIGQMFFPVVSFISFWRKEQKYEAYICGLWLGESMMYMAEYMGDAKAQLLPLVGGHIHDWHWLFSRSGMLDSSKGIASFVHFLASLIVIFFIVQACIVSFRKEPETVKLG